MKVEVRRSIRFKRWMRRHYKKAIHYVIFILITVLIMLIVSDGLAVYYGHQSASDIASRAAVVASQVLELGGDRTSAEEEASRDCERNLAELVRIEFLEEEVKVTIVFQARSVIFKHLPCGRGFTTITASGTHPY